MTLRAIRYLPGAYEGLLRDMPPPGVAGRYFKAMDMERWYVDDGKMWLEIADCDMRSAPEPLLLRVFADASPTY